VPAALERVGALLVVTGADGTAVYG
jgi:hypothetical protein